MTPVEGVDALGHPDPAKTYAAGKRFVCLYLKDTTRAQIDAYHAHSVAVVLISEQSGRDSLGGSAAGVARGKVDAAALGALGAPAGVACYAAEADFQPTDAELPTVAEYALGHQHGIGTVYRSGFYGGLAAVTAAANAGYRGFLWQTYAWSRGQWAAHLALEQYLNGQTLAGVGVDLDRALLADYGAWTPDTPKPTPAPTPPPTPQPVPTPTSTVKDDFVMLIFRPGIGYYLLAAGQLVSLDDPGYQSIKADALPSLTADAAQWATLVAAFGEPVA